MGVKIWVCLHLLYKNIITKIFNDYHDDCNNHNISNLNTANICSPFFFAPCIYAALIGNISLVSSNNIIINNIFTIAYIFYACYKGDAICVQWRSRGKRKKKKLEPYKVGRYDLQWFVFALKWGFYRKLLGYYMRYILYSIWTQAKICVHNSIYARQSYNNINK